MSESDVNHLINFWGVSVDEIICCLDNETSEGFLNYLNRDVADERS